VSPITGLGNRSFGDFFHMSILSKNATCHRLIAMFHILPVPGWMQRVTANLGCAVGSQTEISRTNSPILGSATGYCGTDCGTAPVGCRTGRSAFSVRPLVRCINLLKCPQLAQLLGSFLHGVTTDTSATPSRSFEPFPFLMVAKASHAAPRMARQALEPNEAWRAPKASIAALDIVSLCF
jgi:hypothetical protein